MSLTPDWAPNLHPLVVHFPIALLTSAVIVDLASLWRPDRATFRDAATWMYLAGTGSALVAYYTGRVGADALTLSPSIEPFVELHEWWAFRATWFYAFFASLRLAVSFIFPPRRLTSISAFLIAIVGLGLLVKTAEQGAVLVYRYGVGVYGPDGGGPGQP